VFVAYSRKDREFTEWLVSRLRRRDFAPLWDRDIIAGPYPAALARMIDVCDAGVIVLSPDSCGSPVVNDEILRLVERHRRESVPVLPVLLRNIRPDELPLHLESFQQIDFRESSRTARNAALASLAAALRAALRIRTAPLQGAVRERRWGLLPVLLTAVTVASLIPLGLAAFLQPWLADRIESLRSTQRAVQQLDERVNELAGGIRALSGSGTRGYVDPLSREHIATDEWVNGRLSQRTFLRAGQLVARDEYLYADGAVVGKKRMHFDRALRIILTDLHGQSGAFVEKLDCPRGEVSRCTSRVDTLQSPLPPAGLIFFYR
jgi:hypothetical protein